MGIRVLIVEDEAVTATFVERALLNLGYRVAGIANRYSTAASILRQEATDVALVDIRLKGERDGLELARLMREEHDMPIVFMTSRSDEEAVSEAKDLKANGYLVKPFTEESIYSALEIAIGNYIERVAMPAVPKTENGGLSSFNARKVEQHITDHLHEALPLDALAALVGLSKFHFAAVFKETFGLPPHRFVQKLRIQKAQTLLVASNQSVGEISAAVGYDNQAYFAKLFKRETDMTPRAYRSRFAARA